MTLSIELVPLKLFSARIADGWTMVPGYPLKPGDWAVTMAPPGWVPNLGKNTKRGAKSALATKTTKREAQLA